VCDQRRRRRRNTSDAGEQDRSREDLELVERSLWWIWLAAFFLPPKCQLNFLATTTTVLSGSGGGKP